MQTPSTKEFPPEVLFITAYTCFTPIDASLNTAIGMKDWKAAREAAAKLCAMAKTILYECTRTSFSEDQSARIEQMIEKLRDIASA